MNVSQIQAGLELLRRREVTKIEYAGGYHFGKLIMRQSKYCIQMGKYLSMSFRVADVKSIDTRIGLVNIVLK